MVTIARYINGITLNPLEYLLGSNGEVLEFDTGDAAKAFLRDNGFTDDEISSLVFESIISRQEFTDAYATINKIEDLITEATGLFNRIQPAIQQAIFNYHNERGTLQHSLRWGLQAAKEVREDWHTVVANIPCGGENYE
jgi:hypothetical protein